MPLAFALTPAGRCVMAEVGIRFWVRNTFLEVEEPEEQQRTAPGLRARALSAPPFRRSDDPHAEVDQQHRLVSLLSSQMNHFWNSNSAARAIGAPHVAAMASRDFFCPADAQARQRLTRDGDLQEGLATDDRRAVGARALCMARRH
eukprot:CAMPEP_0176254814 /NCGR_PEP_ID=MMETSP0121_2-20121125/36724_1 /TAXON_ID=160619 /ORGANISM="Kryptoperidinium foliaceum, Strain CCMP 1326" /LENGTH=145 /DNA_ID=CAMNT_0017594631 /DNA_START=9 /DNA_END=444 /DNA_ORIENTATION=-